MSNQMKDQMFSTFISDTLLLYLLSVLKKLWHMCVTSTSIKKHYLQSELVYLI